MITEKTDVKAVKLLMIMMFVDREILPFLIKTHTGAKLEEKKQRGIIRTHYYSKDVEEDKSKSFLFLAKNTVKFEMKMIIIQDFILTRFPFGQHHHHYYTNPKSVLINSEIK